MRGLNLVGVLLLGPASLAAQGTVVEAVNSITPQDIIRRIGVIAHDSMRGRDTPSPGLEMTAEWIAREFEAMGLGAGGNAGSFIQRYPLRRTRFSVAASRIEVSGGRTLHFAADAARLRGRATGPNGVTGRTVVLRDSPTGSDAFSGLDVRGAVVIAVTSPDSISRWLRPILAQQPAALIFLTERSDRSWRSLAQSQLRTTLGKGWEAGAQRGGTPIIEVRDAALAAALAANGFDVTAARSGTAPLGAGAGAILLPGLTLTIHLAFETVERLSAPNVVGVLEGSDPMLKHEYIVFSGHMDHVGIRRAIDGDSIYNGADDDASGTIAVVEAAEAFASLNPRPRRSLMFLLVSGEEKGLWGSEYFSEEPTVPIDRIVANLNADMVGRNWRDTIVVIGKEHSDLGTTLNRVNQQHPELNMTAIDDIWPNQRFYFRSDHYNFARKGVPILFFFNGTHDDYHRPSDEVDKIDGEKASRIVKLLFYLGLDIANADQRPVWNPDSYRQIVEGAGR